MAKFVNGVAALLVMMVGIVWTGIVLADVLLLPLVVLRWLLTAL
jgi:hypothetical protein